MVKVPVVEPFLIPVPLIAVMDWALFAVVKLNARKMIIILLSFITVIILFRRDGLVNGHSIGLQWNAPAQIASESYAE